tara:strand:- start:13684 stop:15063 length:1380 start_codon:yes stop_codon:yes gene_type:complete
MAWSTPNWIRNLTYTRDKSGNHWYMQGGNNDWSMEGKTNLDISQNHPILTPALLFRAKLFSQAEFKVIHKDTGKERKNHWLIELMNSPNFYQTQSDFLESLDFMQIAQGKAVVYKKHRIGFDDSKDIEAFYLLNIDLMKWPDGYDSKMLNRSADNDIKNIEIIYDEEGENLKIKVKDLMFFYDLPNMLSQLSGSSQTRGSSLVGGTNTVGGSNFFEVKSRLDGLRQTLINTQDSLLAKNIILKTNGKELITGGAGSNTFPMSDDDKEKAENLYQTGYGLGWNRKRGIVTKANLTHKSLHIALRDLGLDESVKVDGNLIYTALHIPKDIISLEAKKTTYNNFKESMVSYVQNEMQPTLDSFTAVLQGLIEDTNLKLVGSYEHLPIMQFILKERYEGIILKAKALNDLLRTGIPQDIALDMTGFDKSMKLEEIQMIVNGNEQNQSSSSGQETTAEDSGETE